jgi:hypothetical protein
MGWVGQVALMSEIINECRSLFGKRERKIQLGTGIDGKLMMIRWILTS